MRTLFEIIEAAKSNEVTTHDECLYALLAVEALSIFDSSSFQRLAEKDTKKHFLGATYRWKESWNRWKRAGEKSPKEWLGNNNDPTNPEYQQRRKVAKRLLDKIIDGMHNPAVNQMETGK